MDADLNGIPCETVYSRSAVAAYWNGREISGVTFWSAGLYCRDLVARGASYGEAVRYWWYYGMPGRMDADKNGILTRKELEDFQRSMSILVARQRNVALFQGLDKDKNGQLSPAEFANLPMNVPPANPAPVLAQVDTNRDGQISMVEYRTGKLVSFDRMDADKDGIVSVAEMKAAGLLK